MNDASPAPWDSRPGASRPLKSPLPMLAVLLLFLAFSGSAIAAEPADLSFLQGLGETRYHRLESETLGRPLHVYVRAPDAANAPVEALPTVYLLDGGVTFPPCPRRPKRFVRA